MKSEFPYYVHLFDHMLCMCDQNSVTVTACPGHRAFLFHSPIAIPWYGFQLENPLPYCICHYNLLIQLQVNVFSNMYSHVPEKLSSHS